MSGIYALLDRRGRPLGPRDRAVLGLEATGDTTFSAAAIDAITPTALQVLSRHGRTTLFLGQLDEPAAVADRLGHARTTGHGELARAALDRFGPETPAELLGGWIMLDHAPTGDVTMMVGIGGRTPMLYANIDGRLAVAPSIHVLSRLSWVGRGLEEDAFLLSLSNCTLDDDRRTRTILPSVRSVPRGGCVRIAAGGAARLHVVDPFVAVPRWTGDRVEAMKAAEELLRRIVRDRLAAASSSGLLLSGGLDSSLIAWAVASEGGAALPALSSAVAPARGMADEIPFAATVAETLGLTLHRIVPPLDAAIYRPSERTLASSNTPTLSPRHYLYDAFADAAAVMGVTELFDGAHGELTMTAVMPVWFWHDWPRGIVRRMRNAARDRPAVSENAVDASIEVALAPHRLRMAGVSLAAVSAAAPRERWIRFAGERWGYSAGARAPLRRDATELHAGHLRLVRPFHDIRLLRLFAGFPASFMVGEGMTRWPARAILAGRLPDSIRLRSRGMPFSPDYELRLVEQAPSAMARMKAFEAAGCDEWFDLAWLRDGLARVAARKSPNLGDLFRVQLTAHACEFLTWWRAV